MTVTLITGANKGLGHEGARRLIAAGHTVYIGARDAKLGRAAADELGGRYVALDVTDDDSVASAAATITEQEGRLDVLVNNAGIFGGQLGADGLTADDFRAEFEVNVFGVVRVTQAMLPLLRAADAPMVINVSSGLGSFGVVTDPARGESQYPTIVYSTSKAAVAMLTLQYSRAVSDIRFNLIDPGFSATDLNGNTGHQTATEGTDAMVHVATLGSDAPTGTFQDRSGPLPW